MADTLGTNPKDLIGAKKVDTSLVPGVAIIHTAHAFFDGAIKYGPYNWRKNKVLARVYVAAAQRHLLAWLDREETAEDSGAHHLGHAMACCAILLDAQATGNLGDDRPLSGVASALMKEINDLIKTRLETASETRNPAPAGNGTV